MMAGGRAQAELHEPEAATATEFVLRPSRDRNPADVLLLDETAEKVTGLRR
jgi:hypothetical protein